MSSTVLDIPPVECAKKPVSAEGTDQQSLAVVELLKQPSAYPDRPGRVSLIETHISWVFVTDRFVYKLKKPVRFDFLDFSTPEARQRACRAEYTLNGRMARGVYLAVVPITLDARRGLTLNGDGGIVDWVVKMQRLPADRMLDKLLLARQLSDAEAERLANWLANYYDRLSPLCMDAPVYRQAITRHVLSNRLELLDPKHALSTDLVKRCHSAQMRFLAVSPEQIDDRVCDGRIVEGHGDLRPEHICLEGEPVIFDCLEFNEELRRVDVIDELAFLAMECDYLGAERLGQQIIAAYQRVSGDRFSTTLWSFYKCYRACVRAKVAALTALQASPPDDPEPHRQAQAYLAQADQYARRLGPPSVVVMSGLMGSGKSTLAVALANRLGSDLLSTDSIRRESLGASASPASFDAGRYSPELRQQIYAEMFHRAGALLAKGVSLVLDGAFLTSEQRRAAQALAESAGAVSLLVHCVCPAEVALERIERRAAEPSLSEARPELYALQQLQEEPFAESQPIAVDTTAAVALQEAAVLDAMRLRFATDL